MVRRKPLLICLLVLLPAAIIACGTASVQQKPQKDGNTEALHKYERTFNPADYDPDIPVEKDEIRPTPPTVETSSPDTVTQTEIVSGFRIQVSFTDNMEQANKIKNDIAPLLVNDAVYVVYEAPYYKVRVGDFLNRPEANVTLRTLVEMGFKDAWIVPDKVQREQ